MSFTGFEQHNVTFGNDAPPPRDISDILYQANHAEGHFVRRDSPLSDEPMHPHEAEDEHHALRDDIEYVLKTAANLSPLVVFGFGFAARSFRGRESNATKHA